RTGVLVLTQPLNWPTSAAPSPARPSATQTSASAVPSPARPSATQASSSSTSAVPSLARPRATQSSNSSTSAGEVTRVRTGVLVLTQPLNWPTSAAPSPARPSTPSPTPTLTPPFPRVRINVPSIDYAWQPKDEVYQQELRSVVYITFATPGKEDASTGFVIAVKGNEALIITTRHGVVDERAEHSNNNATVTLFSEPPQGQSRLSLEANVVDSPFPIAADLAFLTVRGVPADVSYLELAEPGTSGSRGTEVTIIGHPTHGFEWTLQNGYISSRTAQEFQISGASLGPGSSGSPVLNGQNEVVAIIQQVSEDRGQGTTSGFGFALRIDAAIYEHVMQYIAAWNDGTENLRIAWNDDKENPQTLPFTICLPEYNCVENP
ncbi:hypothetical protein C7293_16485, partial [filamentous cyanobacterium CCT1]